MTDRSELIAEIRGCVGVITLNRPKALNSLNLDMLKAMHRHLRTWAGDSRVAAVVVRGAGPSFCAGGDVRAVWQRRGDDLFMDEVYRVEYQLDEYISRYPKPYISLMTGVTMGGGCGISVHGAHRVVTETTMLAMPEVMIGLFPDIAASYFLSRCPGAIGLWMGLTGARLNAADALYAGIANHCMRSSDLEQLIARLAAGNDVGSTLVALGAPPPEGTAERLRPHIDDCFGRESVDAIVAALRKRAEPWAKEALANMAAAAPASLKIAFRVIREGRAKSLRDCLITDFRIAQRLMRQSDYFEGVRALIVDKDRRPVWSPATLENVSPIAIDVCFAPLRSDLELSFS